MNNLWSKLANICLECLQSEIKHLGQALVEHYLKQACEPSECHTCEKKLETPPSDGPKDE